MSKQTIIILNSKPGDEQQAQIISDARSKGYDVMAGIEDSTYIFIPDANVANSDEQTVKGSLIQISNQTDRALRSKGYRHTAIALSKNIIAPLESDGKSKAGATDQITGEGVDWTTLNNLEHMKQVK